MVEKQEGWREKHVGKRGQAFVVSFSKSREGVLMSPLTHTLQKDTTPSSWRQKESTKETKGNRNTRQETKCKARQALDTTENHA